MAGNLDHCQPRLGRIPGSHGRRPSANKAPPAGIPGTRDGAAPHPPADQLHPTILLACPSPSAVDMVAKHAAMCRGRAAPLPLPPPPPALHPHCPSPPAPPAAWSQHGGSPAITTVPPPPTRPGRALSFTPSWPGLTAEHGGTTPLAPPRHRLASPFLARACHPPSNASSPPPPRARSRDAATGGRLGGDRGRGNGAGRGGGSGGLTRRGCGGQGTDQRGYCKIGASCVPQWGRRGSGSPTSGAPGIPAGWRAGGGRPAGARWRPAHLLGRPSGG